MFFITTANTLDTIPRPLLDRMEILRLSGYSEEEKVADRAALPDAAAAEADRPDAGAADASPTRRCSASSAGYTREAGVRRAGAGARPAGPQGGAAVRRGQDGAGRDRRPKTWRELLGPGARSARSRSRKQLPPGVATGLAWTEAGGDVLYVEATLLPDGKGLTLTGQLGEVMQESAEGGAELRLVARRGAGHRPGDVQQQRRPHPRAGRRDAQGRPVGGRGDGDGAGVAVHRHAGRAAIRR